MGELMNDPFCVACQAHVDRLMASRGVSPCRDPGAPDWWQPGPELTLIADDGPVPPVLLAATEPSPDALRLAVTSLRATVEIEQVEGEIEVDRVRFPGALELVRVNGTPFDPLNWQRGGDALRPVLLPRTTPATPRTLSTAGPFTVWVRGNGEPRIATRVVAKTVLLAPD